MLIANEGGGLKSRAFTLIELLAVIIVIAVIALIATPIIINIAGKTRKQVFVRSLDGILEAVRIDYGIDGFEVPRKYFYKKSNLTLIEKGEELQNKDVGMKGKIDGQGFIYVDRDGIRIEDLCNKEYCANGKEDNIIITPNETGEVPDYDITDPTITLKGESTIYVGLKETYIEQGAIAKTIGGQVLEYTKEIRVDGEVVSNIDTSIENTYEITYKVESNEKEASVKRTVIVLDMKPEITMTEPNENAVTSKEVLITVSGIIPNTVTGFTYEIKVNGESIKTETVRGTKTTLVLETDGINEIKVTATDNNSHTNTATKTYKIDRTGPVITVDPKEVTLESERVQDYDILNGISIRDGFEGEIENSRIKIGGDPLLKIPGRYEVTYTVRDNLGNETTETRVFMVEDKTKPVITITPEETTKYVKSQNIKIEANDNIRVDEIKYVIIKNNVRGREQTITNGGSITFNETGNYQIEVTAKDVSNNISSKTSKTYKIDRELPEITFKEEITLKANEVAGFNLMEDDTVVVTDNSEIVTWEVEGELNTTVGKQKVTYIARDEAGNETRKERTFEITDSDGPVINYSSASSNNIWIGKQTITLYARIEVENDELTSFSYQVDSGTVVNVPITNNQQTDTQVILNTTGKHSIKIKAEGKYENETEKTIGEFWIDVTAPTVGNINGNNDTWATSKTLTSTLTDNDSKIKYYAFIKGNATKPASDSTDWVSVTEVASYSFSKTILENGTYYLWAKDSVGNISEVKSVVVNKIDRDKPTAPTMNFVFGNWTAYTDKAWTNQSVYAGRTQSDQRPTGATDGNGSGVAKYQISKDSKTWEDYNYTYSSSDNMYSMHSEGTHTRYFRAVDNVGNVSEPISRTARIDKTKPTAGTANCNGSACGTGWYTSDITVTAVNGSDTLGTNNSGHNSTTVSPSKITSNTSSQVIAVTTTDNAGNQETRTYTVKLDKQAPTIANGSSGVTNITEKTNSAIPGSYFSITNPPTYSGVGTISCINISNGTAVDNTNKLSVGTHNIRCTVTRGNGLSAYLDRTFTIKSAAMTGTELATSKGLTNVAGGYRYQGGNPNNYVRFNNELWRIIGVFGGQMKIRKATRMEAIDGKCNLSDGATPSNPWSELCFKNFLQYYYDQKIESTSKSYIDATHTWRSGVLQSFSVTDRATAYQNLSSGGKTWKGPIALIEPADYGYATNGTNCDTNMTTWYSGGGGDTSCYSANYNWLTLTDSSSNQATMVGLKGNSGFYYIKKEGNLVLSSVSSAPSSDFPVVYLLSTVKITGGTGTSGDPYILGK